MTKILETPPVGTAVHGVFWTPDERFIGELAAYIGNRKVLEVFAGNGLLAAYLSKKGVNITSTSLFRSHDSHEYGMYFPVIEMQASAAVDELGANCDVLLMSWPVVTQDALLAALKWGRGRPIIFVGETTDYQLNQLGGCATDEFFEAVRIEHEFEHYPKLRWFERAVVYQLRERPGPRPVPEVLAHFDRIAAEYCKITANADMRRDLARFSAHLPGARVVDAGCGSGRDTKAMRAMGLEVYAYDGAPQIVAQARVNLGDESVQHHPHSQISELLVANQYSGVWACASLIFLNDDELKAALADFHAVLSPGGVLYMSFKEGSDWNEESRHIPFACEEWLSEIAPSYSLVEKWRSESDALGRSNSWVSILLKRQ